MNSLAERIGTSTMSLPYTLDRTVVIGATPDTVFRFFTDSARWAKWWGKGSTIEPRVGGRVHIVHSEGTESVGEVLEIEPPRRIVFTFSYPSAPPVEGDRSRVTIELGDHPRGTRLELHHAFAEAKARDEFIQGWRYQLSVFGNIVSDEVNAGAADLADAYFDAWANPDQAARDASLDRILSPNVTVRDKFSNLEGVAELSTHIGAALRFMPGIRMKRTGEIRHCQGVALADWVATGNDGSEKMRGTNVFVLGPTGKIESVTGIVVSDTRR